VIDQLPTIEGFSLTARTVKDLSFAFEVILLGGTLPNVCNMKHVGQSDEVQLKTSIRMDSILAAQFVN
jgi:riboflavin synthase alpha subunit